MQNKEKALFAIVSNTANKYRPTGICLPLPEVRVRPPPLHNPAPVRLVLDAPFQIPTLYNTKNRQAVRHRSCLTTFRFFGVVCPN